MRTDLPELTRIAARIFDVPLLIEPHKFEMLMHVLSDRLGLSELEINGEVVPLHADLSAQMSNQSFTGQERKPYAMNRDGIALIPVYGTLVRRSSGFDAMSGMTSYAQLARTFAAAMADQDVLGVMLDVDSPGGEAAGVFEFASKIFNSRGTKPVRAIANESAYSAAYAIAAAADRLYISPTTGGVGSIGVITAHMDRSKYLDKQGIKVTTVFAGARKNDGNPNEPLSDEAQATMQARVDRLYDIFTQHVGMTRGDKGLTAEKARKTEARLYQGADAVKNGLADAAMTQEDALSEFAADVKSKNPGHFSIGMANQQTKETLMSTEAEKAAAAVAEKAAADKAAADKAAAEKASTVTALDAHRKEGHAAALAYAREVTQLCALAGKPEMAASFIDKEAAISEVREKLLATRASSQDNSALETHVDMLGKNGLDTAALASNPIVAACDKLGAQMRASAGIK